MAILPELIDVNLYPSNSSPREMVEIAGVAYFFADMLPGRVALWRTDGTTEGTFQVRDFQSRGYEPSPVGMTEIGGALYFTADDGENGEELWKSDGTAAGTLMLKDVNPNGSSNIRYLTNADGVLYFIANDGVHGMELWKSDGTAAGTTLTADIHPSNDYTWPANLAAVGTAVFFSAYAGEEHRTLWRSEGSAATTVNLGTVSPKLLTNVDGTLYFKADDGAVPDQLFRSDGTSAGTERFGEITIADSLTNVDGVLYFHALAAPSFGELWRTDGTPEGTVRLKQFDSVVVQPMVQEVTVVGSTIFFVGPGTEPYHTALWKSDGTSEGTVRVLSESSSSRVYPRGLVNVNGTLFFNGYVPELGFELWKSDGTSEGTALVKDVNPGIYFALDEWGFQHVVVGSKLLFAADDGVHGVELWASDGTFDGTALVKDIPPTTHGSNPREFTEVNGQWFFVADGADRYGALWVTDGTVAGTQMMESATDSFFYSASFLTNVDGVLYFNASGMSDGNGLWRSDGTPSGTYRLPNSPDASPRYLSYLGGKLYFGNDGSYPSAHGREFWTYDVAAESFSLLADVNQGPEGSAPTNFTSLNGTVFFTAYDEEHGRELWRWDGSAASLVKDIAPGSLWGMVGNDLRSLPTLNGAMLFVATTPEFGSELWRSDGTAAGTTMIKEINETSRSAFSQLEDTEFTIIDDVMYFTATDYLWDATELWRTDGTEAGTYRVKDIRPGLYGSYPRSLTNVNGTLYFTADDGVHGYQVWRTDGTESGTVMVAEIGDGAAAPTGLANVNGALMFAANDGLHGTEIWKSDGTTAGTRLFAELIADPDSLPVSRILYLNEAPFVIATSPDSGVEMWRLSTAPAGDYTLDNVIDGRDFLRWQREYGSIATPIGGGADGDGDGTIGAGDLDVWKSHFGPPSASTAAGSAAVAAFVAPAIAAADEFARDEFNVDSAAVGAAEDRAVSSRLAARDALFAAGDFAQRYIESENTSFRERWRRRR